MATFTNQTKNTASFTEQSKNISVWDTGTSFLKKEDSFYLLLENGFKIILSNIWGRSEWANLTKN